MNAFLQRAVVRECGRVEGVPYVGQKFESSGRPRHCHGGRSGVTTQRATHTHSLHARSQTHTRARTHAGLRNCASHFAPCSALYCIWLQAGRYRDDDGDGQPLDWTSRYRPGRAKPARPANIHQSATLYSHRALTPSNNRRQWPRRLPPFFIPSESFHSGE